MELTLIEEASIKQLITSTKYSKRLSTALYKTWIFHDEDSHSSPSDIGTDIYFYSINYGNWKHEN